MKKLTEMTPYELEIIETELNGFAGFGMLADEYGLTITRVKAALEANGISYLYPINQPKTSEIRELLARCVKGLNRFVNSKGIANSLAVEIARIMESCEKMQIDLIQKPHE